MSFRWGLRLTEERKQKQPCCVLTLTPSFYFVESLKVFNHTNQMSELLKINQNKQVRKMK